MIFRGQFSRVVIATIFLGLLDLFSWGASSLGVSGDEGPQNRNLKYQPLRYIVKLVTVIMCKR